jgi:hypothetical protein
VFCRDRGPDRAHFLNDRVLGHGLRAPSVLLACK